MRQLILSAAIPALLMGACAGTPVEIGSDEVVVSTNDAPPPHFPRDLTPAGVAAADDHLALEQVDGLLLRIPYFQRLAWVAVIEYSNPRK